MTWCTTKRAFLLVFILGCIVAGGSYLQLPLDREIFSNQNTISLKITDRHGIVLREVLSAEGGRSTWLTYEHIPETIIRAVLSAEDKRFFSHNGIDWLALGRAMLQNLRARRIVSGASTITQQVIKNRFHLPRTVSGKMREMILAIRLEHTFSKQKILEYYLNRVEFSNLAFGIEAAANVYFRKPASHLSLAESAFLAGLIQAPSRLNPYRYLDRAVRRQQLLLQRMYEQHTIDEMTYHIARNEELRLVPRQANFKAPHFCEMVLVSQDNEQGALASLNFQPDALASGEIRTTLDYYVQEQIEEIIAIRIGELEDYNVTNAAVLSVVLSVSSTPAISS